MDNQLKHLEEFRQVIDNYEVSAAGRKILDKTELVLLVGPTSAGKNTIVNKLLKTGQYHWVVSDTTRAPRENDGILEQNGVEYWFRPEEEILEDLKKGEFLEAAIIHGQQVSGTSLRELKTASAQGQTALHELEVSGVHNIMKLKPDAKPFFILPPSFEEWIRRLNKRGRLTKEEKKRRLETTINEFKVALERDYFTLVVNDRIGEAVELIRKHVDSGEKDFEQHEIGRNIAESLLVRTTEFLKEAS